MADEGVELPIFELPLVLLPGELLPLHIFEERYKRMIARCLEQSEPFGIVFRDDEEMGAGQCLGSALEGALDDAENLIVICSPAAAQSKWVDAEVRRFKRRGGVKFTNG